MIPCAAIRSSERMRKESCTATCITSPASKFSQQLPISLNQHFGVVFQDADPTGNAMLNEMKRTLFSVVFQDADPTGNAMLNEMKRTLFSALTPEQARLVKTQLEG